MLPAHDGHRSGCCTRRQWLASAVAVPFAAIRPVNGANRTRLPPAAGPLDNPLKGWCPYTDAGPIHQPYSMVFLYVPWRRLEPAEGRYAFEEWEQQDWQRPAAQGKRIVFRVYLDYPKLPTGVPDWLLRRGVQLRRYTAHGGGWSPDYSHPALAAGLERLIAALGDRYDGHPRVAFIQLGLLGFWGEWHTWPEEQLYADERLERRVINAYRRAFKQTLLLARYPRGYAGQQDWLGYHDDMFPEDTYGVPWGFLEALRTSDRLQNWRRAPIAGEMVPNQARLYLGKKYGRTVQAVRMGHFSWLGPYCPALEKPPNELFQRRARALVRMLGYEFRLSWVEAPRQVRVTAELPVAIAVRNRGVAPFYYRWPVVLALLTPGGRIARWQELAVDVRRWLPGEHVVRARLTAPDVPGLYELGLGVVDPATSKPAVRFANRLPVKNGLTMLSRIEVVG